MKKIDTFQNLWSYISYCPICNDTSRQIEINVGPDDLFNISGFSKDDNKLIIDAFVRQSHYRHHYEVIIDTAANSVVINKEKKSSPDIENFYFYIHGSCTICDSYINSADIEIKDNTLFNVAIEQEAFTLKKYKDKFYLSCHYDTNQMLIYKLVKDEWGMLIQDDKEFVSPIINLDFSNQKKIINKIKTILVFS